MTSPLVKICGTTTPEDARLAEQAGADMIGVVVEHVPSPRNVSLERAGEIGGATVVPLVALCVNMPLERLRTVWEVLHPYALQLHGDEPPELVQALKAENITVWVACHTPQRAQLMHKAGADALLFDARVQSEDGTVYGGTGQRGDWVLAREWVERGTRVILAGGLNPDNVAEAIRAVQPWAVDVVSGVEALKGIKDEAKVRAFVEAAKGLISALSCSRCGCEIPTNSTPYRGIKTHARLCAACAEKERRDWTAAFDIGQIESVPAKLILFVLLIMLVGYVMRSCGHSS